jgi:hypothetical protein
VCIYVQTSLTGSMPFLVHPKPPNAGPGVGTLLSSGTSIFETRLPAFNDPEPGAPAPNFQYALSAPAPTDIVVGMEGSSKVYMDHVLSLTNYTAPTATFAKSPLAEPYLAEFIKRGYWGDGNGQMFAYSTCKWLGKCAATDYVGSSCTRTLSSTDSSSTFQGYCYKSDTGSLECGRATALDDEYGESPINLWDTDPFTPYRCPMGSPAKTLGSFVSKRMKVAGCMVTSDPKYDPLAEVHVPDFCMVSTAPWKKGCLMPGALNFDPAAKMSGHCAWPTKGCTNSGAFGYNPLATVSDPSATCIPRQYGCTVTDSNLVVNYEASANAMASGACAVKIEGCTDPTARNYNSRATINSRTTCIPDIVGCMMPASSSTFPTGAPSAVHPLGYMFGISGPNFDPSATRHDPALCGGSKPYVAGCTDSNALNYRAEATRTTQCYYMVWGCLNRIASNFNCTKAQAAVGSTPAVPAVCNSPTARITNHSVYSCIFNYPPSAASPPPAAAPAGQTIQNTAVSTVAVLGIASELAPPMQATAADYCTYSGCSTEEAQATKMDIKFTYPECLYAEHKTGITTYNSGCGGGRRLQMVEGTTAAELLVTFTTTVADAARAAAISTLVSNDVAGGAASSSLASVITSNLPAGASVQVLYADSRAIEEFAVAYPPPSAPGSSSDEDNSAIIIIIVVVVVVLLGAGGGYVLYKKKKMSKQTYPA